MTLLELSYIFFYIGLFTIGGGQVAITLMYQPIVERGLLTAEEFYNMVAVSESTPGPIGINMATYIGCRLYGIPGGVITTFSTVLPSLIIILFIAKYFERYQNTLFVRTLFDTIKPVSASLSAVAAWNVFSISVILPPAAAQSGVWYSVFSLPRTLFYAAAVVLLTKTRIPVLVYIACGAVFGILFL